MKSQPLNLSSSQPSLRDFIRETIQREGPIPFAWFMEQALYHPAHGYYSSGRCAIGRRGDYFTSVSVGPLFGKLLAAQFAEVWERLGRPDDFTIVEQGAHHGEFAGDALAALRERWPECFATMRYRIVEPFPILQQRQEDTLRSFAEKLEWVKAIDEMAPFCGVHFSNELLDAMPVHLLIAEDGKWQERFVDSNSSGFTFVERPAENRLLGKLPFPPAAGYETEVNLATLAWIETLAPKLQRGVILTADYGFNREVFCAPERRTGTLQCYAEHRVLPSPLEDVGERDLSAHVEWTSLAERAEAAGLTIAGFTDQHHFLTGLLAADLELATAAAKNNRALQTLLHPEFLGTKFQFLGLTKGEVPALSGFQFGGNPRHALGLI